MKKYIKKNILAEEIPQSYLKVEGMHAYVVSPHELIFDLFALVEAGRIEIAKTLYRRILKGDWVIQIPEPIDL
jgi:aspartate/tyrosine/aromatic aminotransferase